MKSYLADTNLLTRLANSEDPWHGVAARAVLALHGRGEVVQITPQILVEFRAVATRPIAANGLGLPPAEAEARSAEFEAAFPLLAEIPTIFPCWQTLVAASGVIGKQVHDARLIAICHAYQVTHFLTFNGKHFARMAQFPPGVEVVDPTDI